jgi:hypothetical protein
MDKIERALNLACKYLGERLCSSCPIYIECYIETEQITCANFWKKYLLEQVGKEE